MPPARTRPLTGDDCRSCGACCGPPYVAPTYIDLTAAEAARLTAPERRAYVAPGTAALATRHTDDGVICVALRGRLGTDVACAIYDRRPDACRRFVPGSRPCRRLRAYAAID